MKRDSTVQLEWIFKFHPPPPTTLLGFLPTAKILTVFDRLYLRKAKFMYKVSRSETPQYVNELFHERILNEDAPVLRSASAHTFIAPRPNKEIFKQSITYSGPIIWNSLPNHLKSLNSIDSFHSNFIKWLKRH